MQRWQVTKTTINNLAGSLCGFTSDGGPEHAGTTWETSPLTKRSSSMTSLAG